MKIDFQTLITDLAGKPVIGEGESPITLGSLAIGALLSPQVDQRTQQPENLSALEKVRMAKLAQEIYSAKEPIELPVEDVALIKDRIGQSCTPLAVARAWDALDPKEA